jgi:hypothetical protein
MSAGWRNLCRRAVDQFNQLSRRHRLGVVYRIGGGQDANVVVDTLSGRGNFSYAGGTYQVEVPAGRMHGHTSFVHSDLADSRVEKAFIFLPAAPTINTPRGVRGVGDAVKLVIAVHEMVHALGLTDNDHSTEALFQANPPADPGSTAAGDRVRRTGAPGSGYMPPLVLASDTQQKIESVW